jgi:hypothetical protein
VDYIRNVDRGRIAIGQFHFDKEIASAEDALASLRPEGIVSRQNGISSVIMNLKKPANYAVPVVRADDYKGDRSYP